MTDQTMIERCARAIDDAESRYMCGEVDADSIYPVMARAAIEAYEEWLPIESAPKDGTYILLGWFLEGGGGGHPEVSFWHSFEKKWCGRVLLNAEGYFSPTHWRTLPAPPKEDKADG